MVKSLKKEINDLRNDEAWNSFLKNAKHFGDLLDFNMEIPLQRKRKVASTIDERPYTQHEEIQGKK